MTVKSLHKKRAVAAERERAKRIVRHALALTGAPPTEHMQRALDAIEKGETPEAFERRHPIDVGSGAQRAAR